MPVEAIWNSKNYMTAQYSGVVTYEEIRDFMVKLPSDRWNNICYCLSDWTQVTQIEVTEINLKELTIHLSVFGLTLGKLSVALVPGEYENAVEYGNLFVAMMLEQPVEVQMFPTIHEAETWLFNSNQ